MVDLVKVPAAGCSSVTMIVLVAAAQLVNRTLEMYLATPWCKFFKDISGKTLVLDPIFHL